MFTPLFPTLKSIRQTNLVDQGYGRLIVFEMIVFSPAAHQALFL